MHLSEGMQWFCTWFWLLSRSSLGCSRGGGALQETKRGKLSILQKAGWEMMDSNMAIGILVPI